MAAGTDARRAKVTARRPRTQKEDPADQGPSNMQPISGTTESSFGKARVRKDSEKENLKTGSPMSNNYSIKILST